MGLVLLHHMQDAPDHVLWDQARRDCHRRAAVTAIQSLRGRGQPCMPRGHCNGPVHLWMKPLLGHSRGGIWAAQFALQPESCQWVAIRCATRGSAALRQAHLRIPEERRLQHIVGTCTRRRRHEDELVQHEHAIWSHHGCHTHEVLQDVASVWPSLKHQRVLIWSTPAAHSPCHLRKAEARIDWELWREVLHRDHLRPRRSCWGANKAEDSEEVVNLRIRLEQRPPRGGFG
mmetsp:Transcript_107730/g.314979  ORF Transcript_107730/g.314979 Transcript_107730/m.314979 type:complete len:231 (-) Transcript_107730:1132-1824(-)